MQASAGNAGRKQRLSELDYKFWFFPWWKESSYKINPDGVPIPQDLRDYFKALEENEKITLTAGQKAWYAKKYLTQSLDMKREYPATPLEAFETANEGLYYGSLLTRARARGVFERFIMKKACLYLLAGIWGFRTAQPFGFMNCRTRNSSTRIH